MKVSSQKLRVKKLRKLGRERGVYTIKALAAELGCSRTTIYLALENPRRYPIAHEKLRRFAEEVPA